jgi:hypothetical protein
MHSVRLVYPPLLYSSLKGIMAPQRQIRQPFDYSMCSRASLIHSADHSGLVRLTTCYTRLSCRSHTGGCVTGR